MARAELATVVGFALLAQVALAGCVGQRSVEQGPDCSLFDAAAPAGTARLDLSGPKPRPANETFVLSISHVDGEDVSQTRFRQDGCVGFGLPTYGAFTFEVDAPDPEQDDCRWQDIVEETVTEEEGYVDVVLHPRPVCR